MARTKQTARFTCQKLPQKRLKSTGIKKRKAGRRSRSNSSESDAASQPGVDYQQFSLKFDNQL